MGIYRVIEAFNDRNGHGGAYQVDDFYFHKDRAEALTTSNNKVGKPFIKELTVADLKAELDNLVIEYDSKAKKDELENLLLAEIKK